MDWFFKPLNPADNQQSYMLGVWKGFAEVVNDGNPKVCHGAVHETFDIPQINAVDETNHFLNEVSTSPSDPENHGKQRRATKVKSKGEHSRSERLITDITAALEERTRHISIDDSDDDTQSVTVLGDKDIEEEWIDVFGVRRRFIETVLATEFPANAMDMRHTNMHAESASNAELERGGYRIEIRGELNLGATVELPIMIDVEES